MPGKSTRGATSLNGVGSIASRRVSQSCYKVGFDARLRVRPHRCDAPSPPPRECAPVRARPVGWRPPAMSHHALRTVDPVAPLRFLDVGLVVLAAPFVAVSGLPLLGYAVGAGAWVLQRLAGELIERRAQASHDPRTAVGLSVASIIARAWVVGLAIVTVGL